MGDAPGRGRTTGIQFQVREDRNKHNITFQTDKEWAEYLTSFCREIGLTKSAFLRYAAMKEMKNYSQSV